MGGDEKSIRSHFYPRSPCGERRVHYDNYNLHCVISIHALLAESDSWRLAMILLCLYFYPRSPCGERPIHNTEIDKLNDFYPRSPCGERRYSLRHSAQNRHFYPRSPCGERLVVGCA